MDYGLVFALIGSVIAVVIPGVSSGLGIQYASVVSAGAMTEDPRNFGRFLVLLALPGTQGIYGFVICFLILQKVGAPEVRMALHTGDVEFPEQPFDGPTVVITHHLPALKSIAPRYANDPLNPAFASRLEGVIESYRPTLWIHSHTHDPCDYELSQTRIVCNPRGYPGEYGRAGFKPDFTVMV